MADQDLRLDTRPDFGYHREFETPTFKFESTEKEQQEMQAFVAEHDKVCMNFRPAATGQKYAITIIPCGLGMLVGIRCLVCKKLKDVTDTDNW